MRHDDLVFNPPPGWPKPPQGWRPPAGWTPDPSWPNPPEGWQLWIPAEGDSSAQNPAEEKRAVLQELPQESQTVDIDARIALLEAENKLLQRRLELLGDDALVELDDARVLQDAGIYRYHHPLEAAAAYKVLLEME